MTLRATQQAFHDEIIADDEAIRSSSIGIQIYRDAYRARLLSALEVSFEKTRQWVGADAFYQAACHYILTKPPTHWSLDGFGGKFPEALNMLFTEDKEVAELAWLEWQLQQAFAAPNVPKLYASQLAAQYRADDNWDNMTFTMAAGFCSRIISTNCCELWEGLKEGNVDSILRQDIQHVGLVVWRSESFQQYCILEVDEYQALEGIGDGKKLGHITDCFGADKLGPWLARWMQFGFLSEAKIVE